MADYLASIFGTEKDKVNCSFYYKIGACRHGDRCSRIHNKPAFSQTILLQNLYVNLQNAAKTVGKTVSDEENQKHFDQFFEDIYVELEERYGPIDEMNVCDNLGDHLIGNVYVKFEREEDAGKAVEDLNDRWFSGKPVYAELSTVTDFQEASCRQYEIGACTRGGFCNFMHLKQISKELKRELFNISPRRSRSRRSRSRSRSISITRDRSRSKSPLLPRSRSHKSSRHRSHRSHRSEKSHKPDNYDSKSHSRRNDDTKILRSHRSRSRSGSISKSREISKSRH